MDAFADEFLDRQNRQWKPATLKSNTYLVHKYILPNFGHLTVDAVTVEHVKDWFASMADRPGVANRAMPVLSVMMKMAELWGFRRHNSNPCKNRKRYRMKPKERFLTAEEMARLNAALTRDEFHCPHIVAIIRLLMLTGCRVGEIVPLEWDWIKGKRIHLPDSKSGPRTVWLSSAARALIDAIPRYSPDCPFVFPGRPPTRPIDNIGYQWSRIRDEAELPGLRIHDLRHSFASGGLLVGEGLPMIGKLLGHTQVQTTARYAHLANDPSNPPLIASQAGSPASRDEAGTCFPIQRRLCRRSQLPQGHRQLYSDIFKAADWANPADVKRDIHSISILKDGRAEFNIAGNKYRIVVWIN